MMSLSFSGLRDHISSLTTDLSHTHTRTHTTAFVQREWCFVSVQLLLHLFL